MAETSIESWIDDFAKHPETVTSSIVNGSDFVLRELRDKKPQSDRAGLTFVWVQWGVAGNHLQVREAKVFGQTEKIFEGVSADSAIVMLNGGFFGYDRVGNHIPLGLVVSAGSLLNKKIPWTSGGVVYQDRSGRTGIVAIKEYPGHAGYLHAIQSKPLVVERSAIGIRTRDIARFNRTAIGLTADNHIVVLGAFDGFGQALSLWEFGYVISNLTRLGGPRITSALALDGGPGAHIYIPALKKHYGDSGQNYIPNVVLIRRGSTMDGARKNGYAKARQK